MTDRHGKCQSVPLKQQWLELVITKLAQSVKGFQTKQ